MANQNEQLNEEVLDFDALEKALEQEFDEKNLDLELAIKDREKIGDQQELKKVVLNEIWNQFANQIGLERTQKTSIQEYDEKYSEVYKDIEGIVLEDSKYKDANKSIKEKQVKGVLEDEYTGRKFEINDEVNLDHVVSRKEIFGNLRRKQAGLNTEELANLSENLKPTNEYLNKSKKDTSIESFVATREERERRYAKKLESEKRKINESDKSVADKHSELEHEQKKYEYKVTADDNLMLTADKTARNAINTKIAKGIVVNVGTKAITDAAKQMAIAALFSLLKEIMKAFFEEKIKSIKRFLSKMKDAFKRFWAKILDIFKVGVSSIIGTIVSEIFGPIVSLFNKLSSLIKQGAASVVAAFRYLTDKKNQNQPFSVKIAQVSKIIVSGLVAIGAILSGEFFSKIILSVCPVLGSVAGIIGTFFASLISGLFGAVVIRQIDKWIAGRQKELADQRVIEAGNQVLAIQSAQIEVAKQRVADTREKARTAINARHAEAEEFMKKTITDINNRDAGIFNNEQDRQTTEEIEDNLRLLDELSNQ